MKKPITLIRATFKDNPANKGLLKGFLSILKFIKDPDETSAFSLQRILENKSRYTYFTYTFAKTDKTVTVFCNSAKIYGIEFILEDLAANKIKLNEDCELKDWLAADMFSAKTKTDFWWDWSNDWMFWKQDEEFEKKFKIKIESGIL